MFVVVHRGWGLLTLLIAVFCIPGGVWVGNRVTGSEDGALSFAVGLLLLGSVLVPMGLWLNHRRAAELTRTYADRRRLELDGLVQSGRFNLGHPWPIPTSMAMAQSQADQVHAAETEAYGKAQHNRHTLYGVPMQTWGYIALAIAVVLAVYGLLR